MNSLENLTASINLKLCRSQVSNQSAPLQDAIGNNMRVKRVIYVGFMSVICQYYVGFMSVHETDINWYHIENKAFTLKSMSDVSIF